MFLSPEQVSFCAHLEAPQKDLVTRKRRSKTSVLLPLKFSTKAGLTNVMACADTGSDVNIITAETAQHLGYMEYDDTSPGTQFVLANGKVIRPVGQIQSNIWIGGEHQIGSPPMPCTFHVLLKAAAPIIMGMPFLEHAKVISEHRDKLIRLRRPTFQALSVCSVGKPRLHMVCDIDNELTIATPDTGSEVDLVSPHFVRSRGFEVHPGEEVIELADGSTAICSGFIQATISIGTHFDSKHMSRSKKATHVDFLVLENLSKDVIVGEHYLEELKVFSDNDHVLMLATDESAPSAVNIIRMFGVVDKSISWFKDKLNGGTTRSDGMYPIIYSLNSQLELITDRSLRLFWSKQLSRTRPPTRKRTSRTGGSKDRYASRQRTSRSHRARGNPKNTV
jgi:hypothetical protein